MSQKKKNAPEPIERKPWISRITGYKTIAFVSVGLAIWIAWQIFRTEDNIGKGVLWGIIFGVSVWLVFLGMNAFHSLFGGKK